MAPVSHLSQSIATVCEHRLPIPVEAIHTRAMRSLRVDAIVTMLVCVTACATLPTEVDSGATNSVVAAPPASLCFADSQARAAGPFFCHGPGGTYIAGLPANHGWKPGMRIYFKKDSDTITISRDLGAAWVVAVHEQAAEIRVLMQAPETSLLGTTAYLAGREQSSLAGSFLARVTKREGALLTLDVGSADGVKLGDVYEARDAKQRDLPIGRAVVRTVHRSHAIVKIIDEGQPLDQAEWVLGGSEANSRPRAIKVLVVPFKVASPQPNLARVREALAAVKKLVGTVPVHVVEAKPVAVDSPEKLHETLIQRARAQGADQVVWVPTDCTGEHCPQALHAVVPGSGAVLRPEPLVLPVKPGLNGIDDARATFGQLAHAAGMLEEASYQLRSWAGGRAAVPADALTRLAQIELALGQRERARQWLSAAASHKGGRTYLALADVACNDAEASELAGLEAFLGKQSSATLELRAAHLAALLCTVASRLQTGVDHPRTDRLIKDGLALSATLGDKAAQMTLKRYMGQSLAAQGHFARADQMFAAALKLATAASDRPMQARIGLERAIVRERSGNPLQADRHVRAAYKLFKALRDEQGIGDCVPVLVRLERRLHGIQAAKLLIEAERAALRGQHLERVMFVLGQESAELAIERGELGRASTELGSLSAAARKHRLVAEEASLQGIFAEYYRLSGQTRKARDLLDAYARQDGADQRGPAAARMLLSYARLRLQEGDSAAARSLAGKALRSYMGIGDATGAAEAQLVRAEVEREYGERETAEFYYEEARRLFMRMQDAEGNYKVALGKAALALWRGGAAKAEPLFPPIIRYFQGTGNVLLELEATLLFEWAAFERTHDSDKTLQSLRAIKQKATKQRYARLEAETQLLIACVHRRDSDHIVAEQELAAGQKLYAAIGRHAQRWPCDGVEAREPSPGPGAGSRRTAAARGRPKQP